jgi:hypothetical protein
MNTDFTMRGRHLDSYEASSSLTYGGLACPMMLFERDICADDGPKFAAPRHRDGGPVSPHTIHFRRAGCRRDSRCSRRWSAGRQLK